MFSVTVKTYTLPCRAVPGVRYTMSSEPDPLQTPGQAHESGEQQNAHTVTTVLANKKQMRTFIPSVIAGQLLKNSNITISAATEKKILVNEKSQRKKIQMLKLYT